jgi:hypothetical protein
MLQEKLLAAAGQLSVIVDRFDQSKPLLREAYMILRPILDEVLAGKLKVPGQLPHRAFFFGMYEDSLPAHYLNDANLMNALGDFDEAWRDPRK